jgi:hypothetical protein
MSLLHEVEDGAYGVYVRGRKGSVGHHEIGLDEDMPAASEIDVRRDALQSAKGVFVAIIAPDEGDLAV